MLGVYLAVMFGSIIWSVYYNGKFSEDYLETPVVIGPLILQGSCLMVMVMNWPNPDIEVWFVVGVITTVLSYAFGLKTCWERAKDLTEGNKNDAALAVLTQALLPTGTVLLIIFLLLVIFGGSNNKRSSSNRGRSSGSRRRSRR